MNALTNDHHPSIHYMSTWMSRCQYNKWCCTVDASVCVCVCVCDRQTDREREPHAQDPFCAAPQVQQRDAQRTHMFRNNLCAKRSKARKSRAVAGLKNSHLKSLYVGNSDRCLLRVPFSRRICSCSGLPFCGCVVVSASLLSFFPPFLVLFKAKPPRTSAALPLRSPRHWVWIERDRELATLPGTQPPASLVYICLHSAARSLS